MAERKTERPRRTNPTHALAVTREWSCLLRRRASCPPRRRGRHGRGAPATCAPRGPAPSAGFGSSAPAGRDGRSRGQTSWFAEPRRSAAEGGEGASDSRKPRAGGGGRRHRAFPRFHPLRAARARVRVLPGEVTPPLSPGRPETAGALAGRLGAGFMVMNRPRPFAASVKCTQIRL